MVKCQQEAGQFVFARQAAYHSGFNFGFNVAEAINFALPSWLEMMRTNPPDFCRCKKDSVRIDVSQFLQPKGKEKRAGREEIFRVSRKSKQIKK